MKEIAYGALDLMAANDVATGANIFANSIRNKLKIYPNPATNMVTVDLPDIKIEKLYLYNNLGKCLKEIKVPNNTFKVKFNIDDYNSGIYYVRLESKSGRSEERNNGVFIKN